MGNSKALKINKSSARILPKKLRTILDFQAVGLLAEGSTEDPDFQDLASRYDMGVTDYLVDLIDHPNDPIGRQYIPSKDELHTTPAESDDPIGDHAHSPVKGIVHRYPDRVLLKVTNICAVYCRYCFRKEMIGSGSQSLAEEEFSAAIDYISSHPEIWEVILTGGDPLVLSPRRLQNILERLSAIEHVQVIRIHSRVPVASPKSINETMLSVLNICAKSIYLVLHINHQNEITDEFKKTVINLRKTGCTLLSQSVLLRGVNDDAYTLECLFKGLIKIHIKPYYLHHPDMTKGTSHFRISIQRGQEIMKKLQGRISGICLPTYVLDIPGGYGKIPVNHTYLREECEGTYKLEDFKGSFHSYKEEV